MRLREICQRAAELWRRLLRGRVESREGNQRLEPGGNTCEGQGQAPGTSAPMRLKAAITSTANAPPEKNLSAGELARSVLGPNSGARISNVLVVGKQGSTPVKRMEIRFDDPGQIPVLLNLLTATLMRNGFELGAARNSGIPANEIWLTCPLDNSKKTSLCCAAMIAEHVSPPVAVIPGLHDTGDVRRATQP